MEIEVLDRRGRCAVQDLAFGVDRATDAPDGALLDLVAVAGLLRGAGQSCQFVFANTPGCTTGQPLSASRTLDVTVQ